MTVDTRPRCPQERHRVVPLPTHRVEVRACDVAGRGRFQWFIHSTSATERQAQEYAGGADARRRADGPDPAAQPRGRGVAARGDDAEPRGAHGRGRSAHRGARLLQARARHHLRRRVHAAQPRRTGRPGHGRRGAAAQRPARGARRPRRRCCASRPRTPASANAAHYAQIVSELSMLRKLIETAGDIQHMAFEVDDDVDETLDRAEAMIFEVAEKRVSDSLVPLYPVLEADAGAARSTSTTATPRITGVPTGFHDLDDLLLGLQPSTLNVLAARPGQGKTSLALGAALHCALVATQAGAVLLDGDGPPRAHEAAARGRSRHRGPQALDRQAQRARVAEAAPGRRPARGSAVLHRRQPALHGHGDAGQGAPHARRASATSG